MPKVEIARWVGNRDDADPQRALLVVPGMNYSIQMPLLMLPSFALSAQRWTVWHVTWDLSDIADDERALSDTVQDAAARLASAAGSAKSMVVLAKSIGTLAAPWAATHGLPGAWLTPLLNRPAVVEGLNRSKAPALLVGGARDRAWDREAAQGTGKQLIEVPGANHALFAGQWRSHLRDLETVTDRVLSFVEDVEHHPATLTRA